MTKTSQDLHALGLMIDEAFTPHGVLGLPRDASGDEIRAAYIDLAKDFHPDAHPNDPFAERRFKRVTEAYNQIRSPYPSLEPRKKATSSHVRGIVTAVLFFAVSPALILIMTRSEQRVTGPVEAQSPNGPGYPLTAEAASGPEADAPPGNKTTGSFAAFKTTPVQQIPISTSGTELAALDTRDLSALHRDAGEGLTSTTGPEGESAMAESSDNRELQPLATSRTATASAAPPETISSPSADAAARLVKPRLTGRVAKIQPVIAPAPKASVQQGSAAGTHTAAKAGRIGEILAGGL